jgi:hypothetical protein
MAADVLTSAMTRLSRRSAGGIEGGGGIRYTVVAGSLGV